MNEKFKKIGKVFPNLIKIIRDQRKQNNGNKNKIKIKEMPLRPNGHF